MKRISILSLLVWLCLPLSASSEFTEGRIADISPTGWLKEFLSRQQSGLSGHPEAMAYPYNSCLWAGEIKRNEVNGSYGDDWWRYEQTAYYTDGLLRLAILSGDAVLKAKAMEGIDHLFATVAPNGRLGKVFTEEGFGLWPFAVFFRAILACYESGCNPAIPAALEKHYLSLDPSEIAVKRNINTVEGILWTYSKTGNVALLDLAQHSWLQSRGNLTEERCNSGKPVSMHGVTYAEEMKIPMLLYMHTGNERYLTAALNAAKKIDDFYMLPDGIPSSSEYLRGMDIMNAHETCDITDFTWSWGYFLLATGDGSWADHIEKAVFNAGPGAVTKDFKALQYFSCVNQVICTGNSDHNAFKFGRTWMAYRPTHETECCAGNVHRFMPNFAARMWLNGKAPGSLVAAMYAPSVVRHRVAAGKRSKDLTITEDTNYPFDGDVRFRFSMRGKIEFPLMLRIPGWCPSYRITINGESIESVPEKGFVTINRCFGDGDELVLSMDMPLEVKPAYGRGVYFQRGPVLFSYPVPARMEEDTVEYDFMHGKVPLNNDFKCWNILPAGKWNYAFVPSAGNPEVVLGSMDGYPFDDAQTGIRLKIKAAPIVAWKLIDNRFTPALPEYSVRNGELTTIELVPYGATTLRVTVFPVLE